MRFHTWKESKRRKRGENSARIDYSLIHENAYIYIYIWIDR